MSHTSWFTDTGAALNTADGKRVKILEFTHDASDTGVMDEWARHFRRHYISDVDLTAEAAANGISKSDFLSGIKFPDDSPMGKSIRSGDFAEILVADYLEYVMGFAVPQTRYDRKQVRNSSLQGTDILAFRITAGRVSPQDEMLTCEVKAALSRRSTDLLQRAVEDSKKDFDKRTAEALNAVKQRLKDRGDIETAAVVERFQNRTDHPYKLTTGAAAVASNSAWDDVVVTGCSAAHPNSRQFLVVIKGDSLMQLAGQLYQRACATA
jgi:hypothetical protein